MNKISETLPTSWRRELIEDLFAPLEDGRTMHQGWSPQCEKEPSPEETQWGVLKTTAIQAGEFQPEHNKLLPSKLDPRPLLEVKPGDILLTCAGPRVRCGVACLVRRTRARLLISGKMYRFRPKPSVMEPGYLEAFLLTEEARQAIDRMKTGGSDSGLNLTHERFRKLSVPVAPLPEQRRIVAEIEKQFTRLEAGVAALKRVQANLKRYRAAVLKAACEGRLVPTEAEIARNEGRAYESGTALLARILSERRKNWQGRGKYKEPAAPQADSLGALPEGWAWASGEQLFSWASGEGLTQKDIQEGKFPVYGGNGVTGYHNAFVTHTPTLVVGRVGALCGNVYLTDGPAWITDNAIYAIKIPTCVSMRFIRLAFTRAELNKRAAGSGQPFVNQRMLNETAIALPPLPEQIRIVAEVERRLSVIEGIEATVDANLKRAARLRQSVLQKAFSGELLY